MNSVRSYFFQNPYLKRIFFFFFQIHAAEDQEEEALKFLPVGGKISIECDPKYDPDTFMKVEGHFNPGFFNPKLQPQTFQPRTFQS
jgi:hypothetical protein